MTDKLFIPRSLDGVSPLKKVAAIHDLSSFGRCALTVIMPTLSAMGPSGHTRADLPFVLAYGWVFRYVF